jgi:hypothetical protein
MMANEIVRAADVNVDELKRIGALMAQCGYFEKTGTIEQQVAQMAVKVMAGREMGYGPFASVQGIHVIQGKPALSANIMAAAVKASTRYDYRVRKMDATLCEIEFFERTATGKESLGVSSFSAAEAKAAQVKNMDKFPRNMLFARAMSNGVKWYCPDVFNGNAVYVPEELGANVDGEGNVIDVSYSVVTEVTATNGGANHAPASVAATTSIPAEGAKPTENSSGNTGNGGKVNATEMFKRYAAAKDAARDSGKFNGDKHLDQAWSKKFGECKAGDPANGESFLAAWAEYVAEHEAAHKALNAVTVASVPELNVFDEPEQVTA